MKKAFLAVCFVLTTVAAMAVDVYKGMIQDATTKELLQGATVRLAGKDGKTQKNAVSGLDGSFTFRNIADGSYQLEISYLGYAPLRQTITISGTTGTTVFTLTAASTGKELNTVTVVGKTDKGSEAATLGIQRSADNIRNVVSAKAIEVSPDLSVANVTQRISGVSLQRSTNGEGQYAIVRGMDKRYNYTLINGIKIPSPDNRNRYVPLDIFPAELLDRLEVTKALTPNMEGDAIGGVVNMVMKEAPSGFTLRANVGATYAQPFIDGKKFTTFDRSATNGKSPRDRNGDNYLATNADFPNNPYHYATKTPLAFNGGLTIGGRLLNNKLGVLLSASSQNSYRDVQSLFFGTETDRATNNTSFTSVQRRSYSIQQNRSGLHNFWDYAFNRNHKLTLYLAYLTLLQQDYRIASDTNLTLGRVGIGTGRIGNNIRSTYQLQKIYNATLKGDHKLGQHLLLNWSAVYSKATNNQPGRASLELTTGVTKDSTGKLTQQPVYVDNSTFRDWTRNSDEDKAAYLNLTYQSNIANVKVDWTAGGMYRDKDRENHYDNYNLRPSPSPQLYTGNADVNTFAVFNPQGTSTDLLNYNSFEKVGAYYAMAKVDRGNWQLVAGARAEHTQFSWLTAAPKTVEGAEGKISYYDILPSVHLKYKLSSKQYLRASYFSSISRPGFYEVIPHYYLGSDVTDYPEAGNPYLKRTTAENFDLRYEYFPKGIDQVLVGAFYKRLENPIEYALVNAGAGRTYYQPFNFGVGSNYGFEADVTRYFNSFGIRANYTFTSSRITTSKIRRFQKSLAGGGTELTQDTVFQSRPLQGQSKHIANLSLLYKNGKRGIDAQLAGVYTGGRINTVSPFLDNDVYQKGFVQLDFSAEVRLVKRISVFTKINNLLNTPYQLEVRQPNALVNANIPFQETGENAVARKDTYGANYLLGFRFKL